MAESSKSLDILGIKPIADAALLVVQGTVDGTGAFLGRICLPAAEEFGLLLRDKVSNWRSQNVVSIASSAENILSQRADADRAHAHPRIVSQILEKGSLEDNQQVQLMWAGLLASSCTTDGQSQDNLFFVRLMEQITSLQAVFLDKVCQLATKQCTKEGLIYARDMTLPISQIMTMLGNPEVDQADVELDHLRGLGLLTIDSGFELHQDHGTVTPASIALHLYARCQGHTGSIASYFGISASINEAIDPSDNALPLDRDVSLVT